MELKLKSFAIIFVSRKESYTFLLFICIPEKDFIGKIYLSNFISKTNALTSLSHTILEYLTISYEVIWVITINA